MAAPRLLVLADPKMLPALANGLREGGRFDVLPVPLSDGGAAVAAAPKADAVAVFYGAPGRPLASAVQMLAAAVRAKGGRIVAVLQREHAAQRDECFRAGASDLLFMPMSKDQFVNRLEAAVALSYSPEAGPTSDVQVSSRTAQVKLPKAVVTPAGIHSSAAVPFNPGETVRLSLDVDGTTLQAWGLVAASAPEARIRFAGLVPDEETRFREWAKKYSGAATDSAKTPGPRPSAVPASGPPPGFADRPRVRSDAAPLARSNVPPPAAPPAVTAAQKSAAPSIPDLPSDMLETPPAVAPVAAQPDGIPAPAPSGVDASLFEGIQTPSAPMPAVAPPVEPVLWPVPVSADLAKAAILAALFPTYDQPQAPQEVVLSAKKIAPTLSGGEKAAIERLGAESHFADAAGERVALDVARAEGVELVAASEPTKVDDAAIKELTQRSNAVVARLQKDADGAITRGEVETLQVVRASNAAISRDVLALKAVADRLRGLAAAPRLGAGALDPDMALPGRATSARPPPSKAEAPVRAELKEFEQFQERTPAARKRSALVVAIIAFALALAYVFFFALPRVSEVDTRNVNIPGVVRIEVGGTGARVVVANTFVEKPEPALSQLISLLREQNVSSAALFNVNGAPLGQIDVKSGATSGLKKSNGPPR